MTLDRRFFVTHLAVAPLAAGTLSAAHAQSFPTRSVRLIVPFAPAGSTDVAARFLAEALGPVLGQSVVVENRAGGGGTLGSDAVARAEPDGYTLLLASASSHGVNPAITRRLPFDAVEDFTPVSVTGVSPLVLFAAPGLGVRTTQALIDKLKAEPGKHAYASAGVGSITHLAGELFKLRAGLPDLVHIPYRGGGPAMQAVLTGEVAFTIESLASAASLMQADRVAAIGLASATRSPAFPALPTLAETGLPGFDISTWNIVMAPKGAPPAAVDRLSSAIARVMELESLQARLRSVGTEPVRGSSPAAARAFLIAEIAKFRAIVADAKIPLIDGS